MNLFGILMVLFLGIALGVYLSNNGDFGWPSGSGGQPETPSPQTLQPKQEQVKEAKSEPEKPNTQFIFLDSVPPSSAIPPEKRQPDLSFHEPAPPPEPPQPQPVEFRFILHHDLIYPHSGPQRPIDRYYFHEYLKKARQRNTTVFFKYDETVTGLFVEKLKRELRHQGIRYAGLD
jgi:hypothetical protein